MQATDKILALGMMAVGVTAIALFVTGAVSWDQLGDLDKANAILAFTNMFVTMATFVIKQGLTANAVFNLAPDGYVFSCCLR